MKKLYVIKLKNGDYVGHRHYGDFEGARIYNRKAHATNSARQQNIPEKKYTVIELRLRNLRKPL